MKKAQLYDLERVVRSFSNHRRIEIIDLLERSEGISLSGIAEALKANIKTIGLHLQRLKISGLIYTWSTGSTVGHRLTERGRFILKFLRTIE